MIEQFFRPDSVEQALELKRRYQDEAVWFAGGSKLNATPTRTDKKIAISLQDLELDWIDWDNGALRIGAMSRLQPLRDARFIPAALCEALGFVYSRHVRNQSTIGGEIAARQEESVLLPVLLQWTLLIRACEHELAKNPSPEAAERLQRIHDEGEKEFAKRAEIAEKELHYQVIPIRKLIAVQLESGMLVADYLQKHR